MKKLLLGSIALVMIVLALAGCGKTTSSSSATTKELTFNGQTYTVPKDPQKLLYYLILFYLCFMLSMVRLLAVPIQRIN